MTSNTTQKKEIHQELQVSNQQKMGIQGDYSENELLLLAKAWEITEPQS